MSQLASKYYDLNSPLIALTNKNKIQIEIYHHLFVNIEIIDNNITTHLNYSIYQYVISTLT